MMEFRESPQETGLQARLTVSEVLRLRPQVEAKLAAAHALLIEANDMAARIGCDLGDVAGPNASRRHTKCEADLFDKKNPIPSAMKWFDAKAWSFVFHLTDVGRYLSAEANKKWDQGIENFQFGELTAENIAATVNQLLVDRSEMMVDGVVNIVRRLSWDYKTNTPCKLGARFIVKGFRDSNGWLSYHACEVLDDLDRVFYVLAGEPCPDHTKRWNRRVLEGSAPNGRFEGPHFSVKVYAIGTAHIHVNEDARERLGEINRLVGTRFPNNLPPTRPEKKRAKKPRDPRRGAKNLEKAERARGREEKKDI
jgi:hypothetical protein